MDWRHGLAAMACLQATLVASFAARAATPIIEAESGVSVAPNSCFQIVGSAYDPDGSAADLRVANLPPWAAYSSYRVGTTSYARMYGCPNASVQGAYYVTLLASNGSESTATKYVEIAVGVPRIEVLNEQSTGLPNGYFTVSLAVDRPSGRPLQVSVESSPRWAATSSLQTADKYYVTVYGTPTLRDIGVYDTRLVASDGALTISQSIQFVVAADADSNSTISWLAPTENEDGSLLGDLAGYRFYAWPSDTGSVINQRLFGTNVLVGNLQPGLWKIAVTAVSGGGTESKLSPLLPVLVRAAAP
jgi:hypothetical protein